MPYWSLYYHFAWSVKNCLPLILPEFEERLHSAIAAKAIQLGATVHAVGGIQDHIYIAVSVPPKIALARFVGDVKGNSSHFVNYIIKPDVEFFWQEEYGVLSFGERNLSAVVRYIHKQRIHHNQGTAVERLERLD